MSATGHWKQGTGRQCYLKEQKVLATGLSKQIIIATGCPKKFETGRNTCLVAQSSMRPIVRGH